MKASELAQLSLKELRALRDRVDDAIAEKAISEKAEIKAKLSELASKAGFSVGELFGNGRVRRGSLAAVKYRNPQNPSQTWTGRGRKPNWLIEAGGNSERFKI